MSDLLEAGGNAIVVASQESPIETTCADSVSLMARLRLETASHHHATEDVAFSRAIVAGTLPIESYFAQIKAISEIHEVLEAQLAASTHLAVRRVWHDGLRKLSALQRDVAYLKNRNLDGAASKLPGADEAGRRTILFIAWIHDLARANPVALLGVLYVFEGSMMGSAVLRKHLSASLQLDRDHGLSYHSLYGREVRQRFGDFRARMDEAVHGAKEREQVVVAAGKTFEQIGALLRCLH